MKEIFDWLRDSVYLNNDKAKNFSKDAHVVNKAYVDQIIAEAEVKRKEKEAELRAAVIDEFAEKLKEECWILDVESYRLMKVIDENEIDEIASQMKGEKE